MFAWNYEDDFLAGYDHGKQAGTLNVADHHVVPGKKFFTWGNGPDGRMWDKILTDKDGPYLELMVGAWSDNQPDYSWTQPDEVRMSTRHWYPFREIGGVKNATAKAAVNLEVVNGRASVGFHATAVYPQAEVVIRVREKEVFRQIVAIAPDRPFVSEVALPDGTPESDVEAILRSDGEELVRYQPVVRSEQPKPETVQPPPPPQEIKSNEELYLAGLRLEQFHNARKDPLPYYEEALAPRSGRLPSQHATWSALPETRDVRQGGRAPAYGHSASPTITRVPSRAKDTIISVWPCRRKASSTKRNRLFSGPPGTTARPPPPTLHWPGWPRCAATIGLRWTRRSNRSITTTSPPWRWV